MNIQSLLIKASTTVKEALTQLESTGQGILLLVDVDLKLKNTVTDGDLRRLLLGGAAMDACLGEFPMESPKYIDSSEDVTKAFELMDRFSLDQIPVVDSNQVPCRLIHRRELKHPILLSTPHLGSLEEHFIQEALRTNWIAPLGPNVDAFEKEMAEYLNIPYAAALSSGTAAIHMALRLLNIGAQDTVFCSSLTFVASANPILYQGAMPIFIDSEENSWNMSAAALQRAFVDAQKKKQLPKAVIIVNLYGQSADMEPLLAICNHYEVPVIEDAAESLGAKYHEQSSGTFGTFGVFSFNGNKIITTSGGGLLVSRDQNFIEKAYFFSTQARDSALHYQHSELGYNYRMSNVLAGIGRGQLRVLADRIQSRRSVFAKYQEGLADIAGIEWMPEADFGFSTRWLTAMRINPAKTSLMPSCLIQELAKQQIEARPVWKPLHRQPLFESCAYYPHATKNSVSDQLFQEGVCLPSGSNLSSQNQARVIEAVRKAFS